MNLCGPSAQPPPRPSSHSKFGPFCRLIQRRLGCRPARMRQTSPNLCGPSAQPRPCPTSHSKFGPFCRTDPETTRLPSCENATDLTQFVWPFSSASTSPVATFQIRTVLSTDPETTRLPSCENATDITQSVWPFSSPCLVTPCPGNGTDLKRIIIPNSDRFVVRSRDDSAAVLRECDRHHPICVALQLSLHLACRHIPNSDRIVVSIQRRLGCHPARMQQTSPNLCGPSAQPLPCPSSHSKFGPFCRDDPETTRLPSCENATDITADPFCIISSAGPHESDNPTITFGTLLTSAV
jgi:hypothetical protein